MSLVQMQMHVTFTQGDIVREENVEVIYGDLLRGELEANKLGVPETAGLHMATIYAWCALQRTHRLDPLPYPVFQESVHALNVLKETEKPVDPTTPDPSGSPAS